MPFSRRRNNRRPSKRGYRGSKRELIYKSVPRISTINQKIKRIQSAVELKYNDTLTTGTFVTTPTLVLLNDLSVGVEPTARIGSKINATSIQFRAHVSTDSETLESTRMRFIIFWDRQANGVIPPILGNPLTGDQGLLSIAVVTDPILAPYMMETQERFSIVYDKVHTINPMTTLPAAVQTAEVVPVSIQFKKKIPLSRVVKYDSNDDGGVDDIVSNSLYVTYFSDQDTTPPNMELGTRFIFKDA